MPVWLMHLEESKNSPFHMCFVQLKVNYQSAYGFTLTLSRSHILKKLDSQRPLNQGPFQKLFQLYILCRNSLMVIRETKYLNLLLWVNFVRLEFCREN